MLEQTSYDFDKTSEICRSLTNRRKIFLSLLPEYMKKKHEWEEKSAEAAAERRKWLAEQSKG